jgi:cell division protein FtsQ
VTPPTDTTLTDDAVSDPPPIDPRIRQRRIAIARNQGRRRLLWLGGLSLMAALAVIGWVLLHTGLFGVRVVTVSGVHPHTADAAIVATAGVGRHPPLISIDPGATAARIEALPFIASARVQRRWPDGLAIAVTERVPTLTMAGPGRGWSVLDASGRTLEVLPARPPGLIVLVGHTATGAAPPAPVGGSLPPWAGAALRVSRTLPRAFSAQVVSVTAEPDGTIDLALDSGITVLLGTDTELGDKYEDLAAIIAHGSLRGATTIDVSVPGSPAVG